ncbi:MAG: hypothetical protein LAQ69_40595, partial [Acidobacteriia bacterium]|nr:hypothetical protein [Terriglobia bacterium]
GSHLLLFHQVIAPARHAVQPSNAVSAPVGARGWNAPKEACDCPWQPLDRTAARPVDSVTLCRDCAPWAAGALWAREPQVKPDGDRRVIFSAPESIRIVTHN